MRVARAAAMIALLTGPAFTVPAPAYAQMPNINLIPEVPTKTQEEKEQDAVRDKAYQDSIRKIPDAKTSSDPWGGVRSDAPKASSNTAAAKMSASKTSASKTSSAAKAKVKTGSNAN